MKLKDFLKLCDEEYSNIVLMKHKAPFDVIKDGWTVEEEYPEGEAANHIIFGEWYDWEVDSFNLIDNDHSWNNMQLGIYIYEPESFSDIVNGVVFGDK